MLGVYALLNQLEDEEEEAVANPIIVNRRLYRERIELLDYRDSDLISLYRFPRHIIIDLCTLLRDDLEKETNRSKPIAVDTQVLACLRFLASGGFQNLISEICGISQPTLSRIISAFLDAMIARKDAFIVFPINNPEWVARTKLRFQNIAGIPNVLCLVDGTHIYMRNAPHDPHVFLNRKGRPTINAQTTTDSDNKIVDLVVRYPGSTHDSFIWENCGLRARLMNSNVEGHCLGDKGYPLENRIITPYREGGEELTPQQINFNVRHSRTRVRVEHTIGLVKMAFRAVDDSGGELQYEPAKVCKIFAVCSMLHNLRIGNEVPLPQEAIDAGPVDIHNENPNLAAAEAINDIDGIDVRNGILEFLQQGNL